MKSPRSTPASKRRAKSPAIVGAKVPRPVGRPDGETPPRLDVDRREGRKPQWIIYHGATTQVRTGTTDLAEAQKAFARYLAGLGGKDPTEEIAAAGWTIAEIIADRRKRLPERRETIRGQRIHAMDEILLASSGLMTITQITPESCKAFAKGRKVADATARGELKRLKTIVNGHRKRHGLEFQPVWWLPGKPPARARWLTRSDVARLICAARGRTWDAKTGDWKRKPDGRLAIRAPVLQKSVRALIRVILIGVFTGTRADAILRARWSENASHPHIAVGEERFFRKGEAEPDTNRRRPVAVLPDELLRLVRRWYDADLRHRCDHVVTRFEVGVDGGGSHVVATTKPFGSYVRKRTRDVGERKKNGAANEAGEVFRSLSRFAGLPGVTMHTLRHTCATWLLELADIEDVARYLGVTVRELEETYGQYDPLFTRPAVDALNEWGRAGRPPPTGRGLFAVPRAR